MSRKAGREKENIGRRGKVDQKAGEGREPGRLGSSYQLRNQRGKGRKDQLYRERKEGNQEGQGRKDQLGRGRKGNRKVG